MGHIENVNADGAYHSPENQEFARNNSTSLTLGNMQGKKGEYVFEVVEASIFQLSYYTRKNKTRYRGMIKHKWWAYNRCLWVNLVRIKNWMVEVCPDGIKIGGIEDILIKNAGLLTDFFPLGRS